MGGVVRRYLEERKEEKMKLRCKIKIKTKTKLYIKKGNITHLARLLKNSEK